VTASLKMLKRAEKRLCSYVALLDIAPQSDSGAISLA